MNRKKSLIFLFVLYTFLILLFVKEPFKFYPYSSCSGKMLGGKEAILVCSKKQIHKVGYIENQKYQLTIMETKKEDDLYYLEVFFKKKQMHQSFTIYFKDKEKSLWKLLEKEWRIQ